jgi:hypothetical protein
MAVALCLALLVGPASAAWLDTPDRHVQPGPFAVNQDPSTNGRNTDVTVGTYDSSRNLVTLEKYTDDTKPMLLVNLSLSADSLQFIAVSPMRTLIMLIRGTQTTKNNDPGRFQEFNVVVSAVWQVMGPIYGVQLRFEESYKATKDKDGLLRQQIRRRVLLEARYALCDHYVCRVKDSSGNASADVAVYGRVAPRRVHATSTKRRST